MSGQDNAFRNIINRDTPMFQMPNSGTKGLIAPHQQIENLNPLAMRANYVYSSL